MTGRPMDYHRLRRGFQYLRLQSGVVCIWSTCLCFALGFIFIFLCVGCGERENKNLVNARSLIQQGKYKESQDITELRSELNLALKADSADPEALCPLNALKIIEPGTNAAARREAVEGIITLAGSLEKEIKDLEAIDKDLLTDDDKNKLEKLNREWTLSLEPTAIVLKSDAGWVRELGRPALDLLIELLKIPNPSIQKDVVNLLVSLKGQTFEVLIEALKNENGMVRRQAVVALGRIGDERAVEPVTDLLDDSDPGVSFYVPVALDMIGGETIVEPLHKALKNETAKVRTAAANILGRIEDKTGIEPLIDLLADDDSYARASAINVLTKIGEPAVPELISILETGAGNVTLPETDFVGDKIGNEYKKVLAKRSALQVTAASILGDIKDTRALNALLAAMKEKAPAEATEEEKSNAASVSSGAAAALGAIGPAAVEPLIRILESTTEDEDARISAASILAAIGDKRAVEPLINALKKDEKKGIRASAATALGTLKDRRAVAPLMQALKDGDVVTKTNAAASLGTIDDETATQALMDVVMDGGEREKVRSAAIDSLGTLQDAKALRTLVKVLIDEREKDSIRKSAASALRAMENAEASEALIALMRGEVVHGAFMPKKGVISKWSKEEGYEARIETWPALAEISAEGEQIEIEVPYRAILRSGTTVRLIKIYVQQGKEAEAGDLIGLISYEDKDIKQEERSSIRSAAASALGKVKGDNALPELIRALDDDKSAAVRSNAATSLKELENAGARSALIKSLKGDDSGSVRSAAANALATIKGADSVPPLMDALRKDKYDSTREKAAWALGEIADKRAVGVLIDALVKGRKGKEEASSVVNQVITALDKLAGNAIDPLVAVLQDTNIDEVPRSRAARILGLIESERALEPLLAALKDESVVVRSEAAKALGLIDDRRAVEALLNALADENEWVTVRANAITSLRELKDERSVEPLIDALGSRITDIRSNAVVALGTLKDKRATMPLIRILENETEDDTIRVSAISSLGSIGDSRAIDPLLKALNSSSLTIRQNAATALGSLAAVSAVKPLMDILADVNAPVALRANAAGALGEIGDKSVTRFFRELLANINESDTVWSAVAEAAGTLRMTDVPAWVSERAYDAWEPAGVRGAAFWALAASAKDFAALLEMLKDGTKEIRAGAALVLGETGRKEAVEPLTKVLREDGEEVVRRDAAKGLAAIADPASEEKLIEAHKQDGTASVKIQSAIALGNIGGEAGIKALIETLKDTSKGKNVRANSAKALGDTGSKDPAIEAALKEVLNDNVANVHFETAEALRKITGENFGYER